MIPNWVLAEVSAFLEQRHAAGEVLIATQGGRITRVECKRVRFAPPRAEADGHDLAICPSCGAVMIERARGQTFVCTCGAKRTYAQVT